MIIPNAPILALCGDIGNPFLTNYREFLIYQANRFQLVFVLSGNHEYYNAIPNQLTTAEEVDQQIESICSSHPNLIYLNKKKYTIGNYDILGCTLWTAVPDHMRQKISNTLNDFRLIYTSKSPPTQLSPEVFDKWFKDSAEWLANEINKSKSQNRKCMVLTHHVPSFQLSGAAVGWASNLESLLKNNGSNVEAWIYGHTHSNDDKIVKGTRIISNQKGYSKEKSLYNPKFVVTI